MTEALEQIAAVLVSQGKVNQARERVVRQLAMNSEDPRLHNLLGKVLAQSQKYSEAEAAYKKAIVLDGRLLVSYANLGELYARQGKLDAVADDSLKAIEIDPKDRRAHGSLGAFLGDYLKVYDQAIVCFRKAI